MTLKYRKFRPRSISDVLPHLVTPLLKSHDVKGAGLLYEWERIMGESFARLSYPSKITYKRGSVAGGVLHLTVDSSLALQIQHTQQQLIDRINTYFGYKAISAFKIKQTHFNLRSPKIPPALSEEEKKELSHQIKGIEDSDLSLALQNLGEALLKKKED